MHTCVYIYIIHIYTSTHTHTCTSDDIRDLLRLQAAPAHASREEAGRGLEGSFFIRVLQSSSP